MNERRVEVFAAIVLAVSAIAVLHHVHEFSQTRFFTADEYQYGHATWLVSQGERPYLDFYEHHFPLSYVIHAPIAAGQASFAERALRLRTVSFGYLLLACLLLGWATWRATEDVSAGLLAVLLPPSLGFGLMSAVDYRADNFGAFLFLACLALLEGNRARGDRGVGRRWLAASCGVLLGLSVLMTQKMLVLGGGSVALMLALDWFRRSEGAPMVARPLAFVLGASAPILFFVILGAKLGLLDRAFDITIFQALAHEAFYPAVSWREYALPYFCAAPVTTIVILASAAGWFFLAPTRDRIFWGTPLLVAFVGGGLIKAQYPYNYVLLCFLVGLCAARGWALLARRLTASVPALRNLALSPLLLLLPLALLPAQLGFVANATSNAHQLELLAKIERLSGPQDSVIDNAGGALFRPHGSYFFHHGQAHRKMFADYFASQLVDDYRESQALLWIIDYRLLDVPEIVQAYFLEHYVRVDPNLFTLGFRTPASQGTTLDMEIDVVQAGDYFVFRDPIRRTGGARSIAASGGGSQLLIDGDPIVTDTIRLTPGSHRLRVLPGAPSHLVTKLPPTAFKVSPEERLRREFELAKPHQLFFEYGEACGSQDDG